jgi:hypothetical protein
MPNGEASQGSDGLITNTARSLRIGTFATSKFVSLNTILTVGLCSCSFARPSGSPRRLCGCSQDVETQILTLFVRFAALVQPAEVIQFLHEGTAIRDFRARVANAKYPWYWWSIVAYSVDNAKSGTNTDKRLSMLHQYQGYLVPFIVRHTLSHDASLIPPVGP